MVDEGVTTQARPRDEWLKTLLLGLLLGFSFTLPISISVAQPFAYAAIPIWFAILFRGQVAPVTRSPFFWPFLIFVALLLLASLTGPSTSHSLARSRRLIPACLLFVMAAVIRVDSPRFSQSILAPFCAFVLGTTCLAFYDMIRIPLEVMRGTALYDTGNMRDPQLYLVASCMLLAAWVYRPIRVPCWLMVLLTGMNIAGLLFHFKRGVWISFAASCLLLAAMTRRYRWIAYLVLGMVVLGSIPQIRGRVDLLRDELNERTGGRVVLWTQVAPRVIQHYPMGTGFRGLDHEHLSSFTHSYVQTGLNHLHNNLLQVTVDAGWLGGGVWLYWMLLTLFLQMRIFLRFRNQDPVLAFVSIACLAAFAGLMVNGLVEFNFGNSVIFMVMILLMGLTDVLYRHAISINPDGRRS